MGSGSLYEVDCATYARTTGSSHSAGFDFVLLVTPFLSSMHLYTFSFIGSLACPPLLSPLQYDLGSAFHHVAVCIVSRFSHQNPVSLAYPARTRTRNRPPRMKIYTSYHTRLATVPVATSICNVSAGQTHLLSRKDDPKGNAAAGLGLRPRIGRAGMLGRRLFGRLPARANRARHANATHRIACHAAGGALAFGLLGPLARRRLTRWPSFLRGTLVLFTRPPRVAC
jgi:hypothetical protein